MKDTLIEVETLKNILISKATGGVVNDLEFRTLRESLLKNQRIKKALPRFLHTCRNISEFWGYIKQESDTYQGRRDHLKNEFDAILTLLENDNSIPADNIITETLSGKVDAHYIQEAWTKSLERRESDPEGAITIARTLLETICKFIMDQEGVKYEEKWEMPQLYKGVQTVLNLSPDKHTEDIFKQILGGCSSVVNGLGALRNKHSDAHGRSHKVPKPSKRHAQLAVNLAGAMADFLFASWEEKSNINETNE
ncbi:abortive infection family protein [Paenibacillus sp. FSL F4-0087]|uniref:abortive infection family protein n=1 Tax=Paenibacillus sp. FSL F4-0087 TaxID=2921368 RepID=UPI00096C0CB6|nr:abortive phage resistance protein [Paenibacillus pabuli]